MHKLFIKFLLSRGGRHALLAILAVQTVTIAIAQTDIGSVKPDAKSTSEASKASNELLKPGFVSGQAGDDYLVSPDDVLDVYVVDVTELSRSYRVNPSGMIVMPLVQKPIPASGLTLLQLADEIEESLRAAGIVMNAQVLVSVQQSRSHSVSITGSVRRPQSYVVFGRTTLLDVISQADGLADDAGQFAMIRRGSIAVRALNLDGNDPAALATKIDIREIMEGHADAVVYPGDRVTIMRAGIVYVIGAVNKPGGYVMRQSSRGMTVMQAVALAEDTKSTARRDQAVIVRVDASSPEGRKEIPVNLKKVLSGKEQDPTLQAEDILFVPDSMGKKIARRSVESIVGVATGMAIYLK